MARVDIPLPGKDADYESRKSRARLENLMVQTNKNGSFKAIIKREGTELFATTPNSDGIISNFVQTSSTSGFYCGESNIYTLLETGTIIDRGAHGLDNSGREVRAIANNVSPSAEVMFNFNISSRATIWDGTTLTTVTDPFFIANNAISGAFLNSRFYFVSTANPDIFFASDVLDGFTYDEFAFASADEVDGKSFRLRAYKSALYIFTDSNVEYWQTTSDATFPLRRVQGASNRQGIINVIVPSTPIDQLRQYIAFVGNDYQVYLIDDGVMSVISDLDFYYRANPEDGDPIIPFVYFIDGPYNKYLCVSSIHASAFSDNAEFTWVYDLTTKQSHYRTSPALDYWLIYRSMNLSGSFNPLNIVCRHAPPQPGDAVPTGIYTVDARLLTDNGVDFDCILQSGSLSFDKDSTIEFIEIEMETGVGNAASPDPVMAVEYSKDGGVNFVAWGTVELGGSTDKSNRIRMNNFGRLVRHTDFVLRLTITEPVKVEFYGAYAEITGGF